MAIAFSAMIYSGCKKEDTVVPAATTSTENKAAINELAAADASFNDAVDIIGAGSLSDITGTEPNPVLSWKGSCAKVLANLDVIPHRAEIDFGKGCLGSDGNLRSGKIIILWEGAYTTEHSYFMISYDGYAVNDNLVQGNAKLVNTGYNHSQNLEFTLDATGTITVPSKTSGVAIMNSDERPLTTTMSYNFHGTREWTSGMMTPTWSDDVYMIKGYTYGTNLNNQTYRSEIVTALRSEMGFPYYTRGLMNLTVSSTLHVIDFGFTDNARDDLASMITGDVMTVIHLDKNPYMIVNTR
jgi:hypothetical protein